MAILLYKIDTSRRILTALDNRVEIIERINIVFFFKLEKRIELLSLTYEIKVLTS